MFGFDRPATRSSRLPEFAAGVVDASRPLNGKLASGQLLFAVLLGVTSLIGSTGCTSLRVPSAQGLDLMSPSSIQLPGFRKNKGTTYSMADGSVPAQSFSPSGSLTEEAYQKIREAQTQNAVVLQVAGDPEPVRLLPLPEGNRSVFVSELLTQTGVTRKFGAIEATLFRPSPESITGVRMDIRFADGGKIDPATDYGLQPGDRVQVRRKTTSTWKSVVNLVLQR